jgi:2-dehydro-3-deoxyphosphogluconate aldolase / (4S)-4-hydroxy-2-oxoglutarate aldolase
VAGAVSDVLSSLHELRVLPIASLADADQAEALADAVTAGGLPALEVTLRTPAALAALRRLAPRSDLLLGAGTVTTVAQVREVLEAGARFVVSPGFSAPVVQACLEAGVPVLPGVATATEIQMALDAGLDTVKFFPAVPAGGVAMIKALAAPFSQVRFVPTGGIGPGNVRDFLALPAVLAVGGSWMVDPALLARGDLDGIRRLTAEAVALTRGGDS